MQSTFEHDSAAVLEGAPVRGPSLLARYLFPLGMAKLPHGDMFLQRATIESNLTVLRRWMPHYAKVHAALAVTLLGIGFSTSTLGAPDWLAAVASLPGLGEFLLAICFSSAAIALRLR